MPSNPNSTRRYGDILKLYGTAFESRFIVFKFSVAAAVAVSVSRVLALSTVLHLLHVRLHLDGALHKTVLATHDRTALVHNLLSHHTLICKTVKCSRSN